KHWLIGHEQIDREHEELIGLINALIDCKEAGDVTLFRTTLDTLCEKIETHFYNETKIMRELGYVEKEHDEKHKIMLSDIKKVKTEISEHNIQEKLQYLIGIFVEKTLKDDIYFAEYLVGINNKIEG
ncbi:MAG: hemerythrin domain-containing protein, partial [Sneathiella sp.]